MLDGLTSPGEELLFGFRPIGVRWRLLHEDLARVVGGLDSFVDRALNGPNIDIARRTSAVDGVLRPEVG